MAIGFPEIAVFLIFCGISLAVYDDLLDRIHLSKSNDPEVRDFLKTILKHHNDFKWIQQASSKKMRNEKIVPLYAWSRKNKRSFHSIAGFKKPHGYRRTKINYGRPVNDAYPHNFEEDLDEDTHKISRRALGIKIEPNSVKGIVKSGKRDCLGDYEDHEVAAPENTTKSAGEVGEFYYSVPHNLLGLEKDVVLEDLGNGTKIKRDAKKDKIKIKIFDQGRLITDIKQGAGSNSIILKVGGGFTKTSPPDDTLQKIDSLINLDKASLRLDPLSLINNSLKGYEMEPIGTTTIKRHLAITRNILGKHSRNLRNFLKRKDESKMRSDVRLIVEPNPYKVNKLEDLTEPTSGAEQRELEKLNEPSTPSMTLLSPDQIILMPFKKEISEKDLKSLTLKKERKSKNSNTDDLLKQLKHDLEEGMKSNLAKLVSGNEVAEGTDEGDDYHYDYKENWGVNGDLNNLGEETPKLQSKSFHKRYNSVEASNNFIDDSLIRRKEKKIVPSTTFKSKHPLNKRQEVENSKSDNQIEIFEKSQAIMLHFTVPPPKNDSHTGNFDEYEDPDLKRVAPNREEKRDGKDDIINQIIDLVDQYKKSRHGSSIPNEDEYVNIAHRSRKNKKLHPPNINKNDCPPAEGGYHRKFVDPELLYERPKAYQEVFIPSDEENSNKRDLNDKNTEDPKNYEDIVEQNPVAFNEEDSLQNDMNEHDPRIPIRLHIVKIQNEEPKQVTNKRRKDKNFYFNPYFDTFPKMRQVSLSSADNITIVASTEPATFTIPLSIIADNNFTTEMSDKKFGEMVNCLDEEKKKKKFKHFGRHKHKEHGMEETGDNTYNLRGGQKDFAIKKNKIDVLSENINIHQRLKGIMNGHVVLNILEKFYDRLKENDKLFKRFGKSLNKKATEEEVSIITAERTDHSKKDVVHAQLMLHQIITMMNRIVADQVHRKTCLNLDSALEVFLKSLLKSVPQQGKSFRVDEGFPVPNDRYSEAAAFRAENQSTFLFQNPSEMYDDSNYDLLLKKKVALLQKLLQKYDRMSKNCQVKVEPIREYLLEHLYMLEKLQEEEKLHPQDKGHFCNSTTDNNTTTIQAKNISEIDANTTAKEFLTTPGFTMPTTYTIREMIKPPNYYDYFDRGNKRRVSKEYRMLVEAADNYRRKRNSKARLAKLFGRHLGDQEVSSKTDRRIGFESPLVYSLDE